MIYNWYSSLLKRYTEGVDFEFAEGEPRHYEHLTWLNGDLPSLETFEGYASEDTELSALETVRTERNKKIALTDWRFRSDLTPSQEWIDYCQALRDITSDSSNWSMDANGMVTINWPTEPES